MSQASTFWLRQRTSVQALQGAMWRSTKRRNRVSVGAISKMESESGPKCWACWVHTAWMPPTHQPAAQGRPFSLFGRYQHGAPALLLAQPVHCVEQVVANIAHLSPIPLAIIPRKIPRVPPRNVKPGARSTVSPSIASRPSVAASPRSPTDRPFNRTSRSIAPWNRLRTPCKR